jgi:hypothetical protein
MHHTSSQEELPVLGFEQQEEEEQQQDVATQEVQTHEKDVEELPECPDHRPSVFERGKPRSISLLWFAN